MVRIGSSARSFALGTHSWHPIGMCLVFTRSCFGVGSYYGSAYAAWLGAQYKHRTTNPNDIPADVPVFFRGGSRGYGHIAYSLGNGLCRSSDWPRAYTVSTGRIADIARAWNHPLVGWTEDLNGVRVYNSSGGGSDKTGGSAAGTTRVHLANLKPGLHNQDVRDLQHALRQHPNLVGLNKHGVTGYFGDETRAMVRAFQRSQGWTGADANGIPGTETCKRLGLKAV